MFVNRHIPALDGIRGLAVAMVMFSHFLIGDEWAGAIWWPIVRSGWIGVDLFFVLSGFLITGILLGTKDKPNYFKHFYIRRVLRIFPLYYFCILVLASCVLYIEKAPMRFQGYDDLWWYLPFASNIAIALKGGWLYQSDWIGLNHFWSLAIEEQFYIFWPVVVFFASRKNLLKICVVVIILSPLLRMALDILYGYESLRSYVLTPCRLDGLCAGSAISVLIQSDYLEEKKQMEWAKWVVGLIGMFTLCVSSMIGGFITNSIASIFFSGILYLAISGKSKGWWQYFFEARFLRHLGKYSYALYIFHHMFNPLWLRAFGTALKESQLPFLVWQPAYIAIAFSCSYAMARISWVVIEHPFISLKDKFARNRE